MKVLLILALSILTISNTVLAKPTVRSGGSGVGNGGDTVRLRFISTGQGIIEYYKDGFKSIDDVLISPILLKRHLNIQTIRTSKDLLIDNLGNPVSAIGEPGSITLYVGDEIPELHWDNIFKNSRLANIMVLHELLRAQGINDDNYVYSSIVLKKQDILDIGNFRMKWAKQSFDIVKTTQLRSFHSKSIEEELNYFEQANKKLKNYNTIELAKLIKLNIEFSKAIKKDAGSLSLLKTMRADYKLLRDVIPMVDKLSYQTIMGENNYKILNSLTLLLLKDFYFKVRMANLEVNQENLSILKNYTSEFISAVSIASENWLICTGIEQSLNSLSSESYVVDKSDINMIISSLLGVLRDERCI